MIKSYLNKKFIKELSEKETESIFSNNKRRFNRSRESVYKSVYRGNLSEYMFGYFYNLKNDDIEKQMLDKHKSNSFSSYDLLYKNKKIEIKFISKDNFEDNYFPIDHTTGDGSHPKYWREKHGGFDYLVCFYIYNNEFKVLGEISWNDYYNKSFRYGRAKNGQKYYDKIKDNPYLERKVMINYKYLKDKGHYLK